MSFIIQYSCVSHIGNIRTINQDNFICDGRYFEGGNCQSITPFYGEATLKCPKVFGVFDGIGGMECGEIASLIAAKEVLEMPLFDNEFDLLSEYCKRTNEKICRYREEKNIQSMGTTAALLSFSKKKITLCNIGDSKIFRFSDNELQQISKDHSVVAAYGTKPMIFQNLGIPSDELIIDPYFAQGKYHNSDVYLICSDGLTDMVSNEQIANILSSNNINNATQMLLDAALKNGGKDNITIILCKVVKKFL